MSDSPKAVCSVGTTDPWNAAGLGLDVRVLEAFGVRPVMVVAGVSAQGPHGIALLHALDPAAIAAQFTQLDEAHVAAYRIGALLDAASVRAVAAHVKRATVPVVYDPVIAASLGGRFADDDTLATIRTELLPHVTLVTPNVGEARVLACDATAAPRDAARDVLALGARAVLVTGIVDGETIVDMLVSQEREQRYAASRLPLELRGTGCMLAAGIAASLAGGCVLDVAIVNARAFVREHILDGETFAGMRLMRVRGRAARGS